MCDSLMVWVRKLLKVLWLNSCVSGLILFFLCVDLSFLFRWCILVLSDLMCVWLFFFCFLRICVMVIMIDSILCLRLVVELLCVRVLSFFIWVWMWLLYLVDWFMVWLRFWMNIYIIWCRFVMMLCVWVLLLW